MSLVLIKVVTDIMGVDGAVTEEVVPTVVTGVFLTLIVLLLVFAIYGFGSAIRAGNSRSSGFMAGVEAAESKHYVEMEALKAEYEHRITELGYNHRRDMRGMELKLEGVLNILHEFVDLVPEDRQSKVAGLLMKLQALQSDTQRRHDDISVISDIKSNQQEQGEKNA